MMRQVKFGDYKCYDDWGLYLKAGWQLAPASTKVVTIDVFGADGVLDLTETVAGEPRYNNRAFSCTLILPPYVRERDEYERKRQQIADYCQGRRMRIHLPDSAEYYLLGRCEVSALSYLGRYAEIGISASCEPWLLKNNVTSVKLAVDGSANVVLRNARKTTIPEIISDGDVELTLNGIVRTVPAGSFKFADFALQQGRHQLWVRGSANVEIKYQEGRL